MLNCAATSTSVQSATSRRASHHCLDHAHCSSPPCPLRASCATRCAACCATRLASSAVIFGAAPPLGAAMCPATAATPAPYWAVAGGAGGKHALPAAPSAADAPSQLGSLPLTGGGPPARLAAMRAAASLAVATAFAIASAGNGAAAAGPVGNGGPGSGPGAGAVAKPPCLVRCCSCLACEVPCFAFAYVLCASVYVTFLGTKHSCPKTAAGALVCSCQYFTVQI